MNTIEEKVEKLISKPINDLGYDIYDIEYTKEGKNFFLRVFIDKPEGIDLNDCETVNNAITDLLDEEDYIKTEYFLEVSSPGIERRLRKNQHFEKYIGNVVELKLFKPINQQKSIKGILKGYNEECITVEVNSNDLVIQRKDISIIKTVYEW